MRQKKQDRPSGARAFPSVGGLGFCVFCRGRFRLGLGLGRGRGDDGDALQGSFALCLLRFAALGFELLNGAELTCTCSTNQPIYGLGGASADGQPVVYALEIQVQYDVAVYERVVDAEKLNVLTIARRAAVRRDNTVERGLFRTVTLQSKANTHDENFLNIGRTYARRRDYEYDLHRATNV